MTNRPGCYDPATLFKPQWAYATPPGYRDEPYLVPFTFTILMNGSLVSSLPVQLDDDAPFIWRAVIFPAVGPLPSAGIGFPGLVRIRDSHGNPITDGLVYTLGAYGLSGLQNQNAFGFPIEPEIECSPGGTILFDLQMSSSGNAATVTDTTGLSSIEFFAALFGTAGNGLTIQMINPGAPNVALSAAVVGGIHVQVTLATDGGGTVTSTASDVSAIMASTPAVAAIMGAKVLANGLVAALAQTPLVGGVNGSTFDLNGTLIGVKRWRECL